MIYRYRHFLLLSLSLTGAVCSFASKPATESTEKRINGLKEEIDSIQKRMNAIILKIEKMQPELEVFQFDPENQIWQKVDKFGGGNLIYMMKEPKTRRLDNEYDKLDKKRTKLLSELGDLLASKSPAIENVD